MKNKIYNIQLDADQMQAVMESLDCALSLCYKGAKARFNRMFDAKHNISVQKDAQKIMTKAQRAKMTTKMDHLTNTNDTEYQLLVTRDELAAIIASLSGQSFQSDAGLLIAESAKHKCEALEMRLSNFKDEEMPF